MEQYADRQQQIEIIPHPRALTNFDRALVQARPLDELGRRILQSHERPDRGEIHYTTTFEAVSEWSKDPHGLRKFEFMANTYGIAQGKLSEVLQKIGLGEYVKAKAEGRLVGQVSTQILKPTYYFMTNALMLGYLNRHYGIPTALMVSTYETDAFSYNNHDKVGALGTIDFPVGIDSDSGRAQTIKIQLMPVGLKQSDGNVRPASSNGLSGQRCCDIMVRIVAAFDEKNKPYPSINNNSEIDSEDAEFYALAALGINIHQKVISLTDFYKQMFIAVINRLRVSGEIPSEEDMPMFFVNGEEVYRTLPKLANPPDQTCKILGGVNTVVNQNLRQLQNGVVVRADSEVMVPAWYYPMEYGLPDIYFECSSCGGEEFVAELARADRLLERHSLPISEVRLPDREVPELESLVVHPSGGHIDLMGARVRIERATASIVADIQRVKEDIAKQRIDRSLGRRQLEVLVKDLHKIRVEKQRKFIQSVMDGQQGMQHRISHDFIIPDIVASVYRELLGDLMHIRL